MKVWAIILAAGEGSRMGGAKLTLPFGATTVVRAAAEAMLKAPVDGITVVLGAHADSVRAALDGIPCQFATNSRPQEGMLSSVRTGIAALPPDVDAFLVALGDQPEVTPPTVRALVRAAETSERLLFIPQYNGRRGHPVLFKSAAIPSIVALPKGAGLNAWRDAHPHDVAMLDVDSEGILHDLDTPDDYRAALARLQPSE